MLVCIVQYILLNLQQRIYFFSFIQNCPWHRYWAQCKLVLRQAHIALEHCCAHVTQRVLLHIRCLHVTLRTSRQQNNNNDMPAIHSICTGPQIHFFDFHSATATAVAVAAATTAAVAVAVAQTIWLHFRMYEQKQLWLESHKMNLFAYVKHLNKYLFFQKPSKNNNNNYDVSVSHFKK